MLFLHLQPRVCTWDRSQPLTFTSWGEDVRSANKLAATHIEDDVISYVMNEARVAHLIYETYKTNRNLTFLKDDYDEQLGDGYNLSNATHYWKGLMCVMISTKLTTFGKWFLVDCEKRIKNYMIVCEKELDTKVSSLTLNSASYECTHKSIYVNTSLGNHLCYQFLNTRSHHQFCISTLDISTYDLNMAYETNMYFTKWARGRTHSIGYYINIASNISLCLKRICQYCDDQNSHDWFADMNCSVHSIDNFLCRTYPTIAQTTCQKGQYQCYDGTCILFHYRCDNIADCPDHSDEMYCDEVCSVGFHCFLSCAQPYCACNKNYIQLDKKCIPLYRWYERWTHRQHNNALTQATQLSEGTRCPNGWSKCTASAKTSCYPNEKICVFERDITGDTLYCKNTEHLQFCEKHKCPSMFSCYNTYCIPFHMVCDGVSDCPDSRDEASERCNNLSCPGMLRCRHDGLCIHHHFYCDGVVHCLVSQDDEDICDSIQCHKGCHCTGRTMFCNDLPRINETLIFGIHALFVAVLGGELNFKQYYPNLNIMNLTHVFLNNKILMRSINRQANLISLTLINNSLSALQSFVLANVSRLEYLTIQLNNLHHLHPYAFSGLHSIKYLNLPALNIKIIGSCCFCNMDNLLAINLSSNAITEIRADIFSTNQIYRVIDLSNNIFHHFDENFMRINVDILQINQRQLCCYVEPLAPFCHSFNRKVLCKFILPANSIASSILIYIALLVLINMYVIIVHLSTKVSHFILIQNLAFVDLTYIFYMVVLVYTSFSYSDQLPLLRVEWITSMRCKVATFLFVLFVLQSKCSSILVEVNYVLAIKYPLKRQSLKQNSIISLLALLWISNFVLAFLFTRYTTQSNIYCTPFPVRGNGGLVILIVFSVFLILRGGFMITCYYTILSEVRKSAVKVKQSNNVVKRRFQILLGKSVLTVAVFIIATVSLMIPMYSETVKNQQILEVLLLNVFIPIDVLMNPFVYTIIPKLRRR